jgi:hypothetical protein
LSGGFENNVRCDEESADAVGSAPLLAGALSAQHPSGELLDDLCDLARRERVGQVPLMGKDDEWVQVGQDRGEGVELGTQVVRLRPPRGGVRER